MLQLVVKMIYIQSYDKTAKNMKALNNQYYIIQSYFTHKINNNKQYLFSSDINNISKSIPRLDSRDQLLKLIIFAQIFYQQPPYTVLCILQLKPATIVITYNTNLKT